MVLRMLHVYLSRYSHELHLPRSLSLAMNWIYLCRRNMFDKSVSHYNQDVPLHNRGPPGTKPYCIPEGKVLHVTASYPYKKLDTDHQFRLLKLLPKSYEPPPLTSMFGLPRSRYLYGMLSDHDLAED